MLELKEGVLARLNEPYSVLGWVYLSGQRTGYVWWASDSWGPQGLYPWECFAWLNITEQLLGRLLCCAPTSWTAFSCMHAFVCMAELSLQACLHHQRVGLSHLDRAYSHNGMVFIIVLMAVVWDLEFDRRIKGKWNTCFLFVLVKEISSSFINTFTYSTRHLLILFLSGYSRL